MAIRTPEFVYQTGESPGVVHFVYRGDATDLAISGDYVGLWDETPMQRIMGTDFFI
jgi:hypothetical protein